ncbi:MAG: hypothetical protein GKS02_03375 [Alphaproteobacteria bacterium]|nr:hypothetical protein [Alphaproteobacteria bacterium]
MQIVMVEFAVGAERLDACVAAVSEITNALVATQAAFHGATIHREEATGTVWNVMRWDSHRAFIEFRDSNAERIGAALGEFQPHGHMLDVAAMVEPQPGRL